MFTIGQESIESTQSVSRRIVARRRRSTAPRSTRRRQPASRRPAGRRTRRRRRTPAGRRRRHPRRRRPLDALGGSLEQVDESIAALLERLVGPVRVPERRERAINVLQQVEDVLLGFG